MVNYTEQLMELWRSQVECGFVLEDPADHKPGERKVLFDMETCVPFNVRWNPARVIRGNHQELIKRGVIAADIDASRLINKDDADKACYLCPKNISIQNPKEVLLEMPLAGQKYLIGANFAPITDNHFTVMSEAHRPQPSGEAMVSQIIDLVDLTNGNFRALYNGLAGASIVRHEHFHITTTHFPIEDIRIEYEDILREAGGVRVSRPKYYMSLRVVEGINKTGTEQAAKDIIAKWHAEDEENHTENIIAAKEGPIYRLQIFFRDKRVLKSIGKSGSPAAFECGGMFTMTGSDEELYKNITLETIKKMLKDISPILK
jgi:hypothetical protein